MLVIGLFAGLLTVPTAPVEAAAVPRLCHLLQRLWLHLAQILRRWRASGPRRFAQMTERTAVPPLGGRARAFARARVR